MSGGVVFGQKLTVVIEALSPPLRNDINSRPASLCSNIIYDTGNVKRYVPATEINITKMEKKASLRPYCRRARRILEPYKPYKPELYKSNVTGTYLNQTVSNDSNFTQTTIHDNDIVQTIDDHTEINTVCTEAVVTAPKIPIPNDDAIPIDFCIERSSSSQIEEVEEIMSVPGNITRVDLVDSCDTDNVSCVNLINSDNQDKMIDVIEVTDNDHSEQLKSTSPNHSIELHHIYPVNNGQHPAIVIEPSEEKPDCYLSNNIDLTEPVPSEYIDKHELSLVISQDKQIMNISHDIEEQTSTSNDNNVVVDEDCLSAVHDEFVSGVLKTDSANIDLTQIDQFVNAEFNNKIGLEEPNLITENFGLVIAESNVISDLNVADNAVLEEDTVNTNCSNYYQVDSFDANHKQSSSMNQMNENVENDIVENNMEELLDDASAAVILPMDVADDVDKLNVEIPKNKTDLDEGSNKTSLTSVGNESPIKKQIINNINMKNNDKKSSEMVNIDLLKYCKRKKCKHKDTSCFAVRLEVMKNIYHIVPLHIVLKDCTIEKVLPLKQMKIEKAVINIKSIERCKTNSNIISTKVISPTTSEYFEETVARKLSERNKKLGVGEILKSPVSLSPIANNMVKENEDKTSNCQPKVNITQKEIKNITDISSEVDCSNEKEVLLKSSSSIVNDKTCTEEKDLSELKINSAKNKLVSAASSPENETNADHTLSFKEKKIKFKPINIFEDDKPPLSPKEISLDQVQQTIESNLTDRKSGSAKRKFMSPKKSLSPNHSQALWLDHTETDIDNSQFKSPSVSPHDVPNLPLHPSLRLKLRSNNSMLPVSPVKCMCNIDSCPHTKLLSPSKHSRRSVDLTEVNVNDSRKLFYHAEDTFFPFNESMLSPSKTPTQNKSRPFKSSRQRSVNFKPSLLPKASPSRSILARSININQLSNNEEVIKACNEIKSERFDCIELSDSDRAFMSSHASSDEDVINPNVVHISSDNETEDEQRGIKIENVKSEKEDVFLPTPKGVVTFVTTGISNLNDVLKTEFDNLDSTLNQESFLCGTAGIELQRRRRKSSSRKHIETFITATSQNITPSFVNISKQNEVEPACTHIIKSVTYRQMKKLKERFKLKPLKVKLVKLDSKVVEQIIQLCSNKDSWNDRSMLLKAGLDLYDMQRLGLLRRDLEKPKYGLRRFLKKRDFFQHILEHPRKKKGSRELFFLKSQKRKMKDLIRTKQLAEKQKKDLESVRRSLLKLNAIFLSQNKFWNYLQQGSSIDKAIEI